MLDTYKGLLCLDPMPVDSRSYGGYAAALRPGDYWEVFPYEADVVDPAWADLDERAASIEISELSAHQRVALRAALERVRHILRSAI